MSNSTDVTLTCSDCENHFEFTSKEQQFYAERELQQPKRCRPCRDKKKLARGETPPVRRPMFEAVCDDCHAKTQLPFQPSENKPVYCRECFNARNA